MSRKHAHRAGNQPVTRRYVAGVVRRARDEIISAIIHQQTWPDQVDQPTYDFAATPSLSRIERAVNG
jgi:phosphoribosylpyrophosphate synthetase